jgi:hypothetical protein
LDLDSVKSILSIPTKTIYVTSFPKRNNITGAPDQVFKFDNFLDYLTGGIRAKTIAAIGTINPGSLCIQYLFAPQIHYYLSSTPIAFIGNSSNKKGKFSMIKVNIKSIRVFVYIKDKATWIPDLPHGEAIPVDKLADTNWKDFEDPIVGTLIPNFFIAYFGQDLPHRDLTDEEIIEKLVRLGSGYELWANTAIAAVEYIDNILTVIDEIKVPESIKRYLDPTRNNKSLQLVMANGPFGAMTNVQSDDYPVAARALKEIFQLSHQTLAPTLPSFPSGNVMLQLPPKIDKESEAKKTRGTPTIKGAVNSAMAIAVTWREPATIQSIKY